MIPFIYTVHCTVPIHPSSSESARGIEGQLTINRMDLLAGIVDSAKFAFNYQSVISGSETQRCFNLLLPGDREEEIAQGKGLVMATRLCLPRWSWESHRNEIVVSGLIFRYPLRTQRRSRKRKRSITRCATPSYRFPIAHGSNNNWNQTVMPSKAM